ncbi:MAG: hypothetical protein Q9220_005527 [cf. Caloplaca sp. 1 TL-2023]
MAPSPLPQTPPSLSLSLSLTPPIHKITSTLPPTLTLHLSSSSTTSAITLFTAQTPLHPSSALKSRLFTITDLATGAEIPQILVQINRLPFSRVRGSGDEELYLTIPPGGCSVSAPFGGRRPEGEGGETHGVDGLKAGRRYRLDVKEEGLRGLWWRWGGREGYLVDEGTEGAERGWEMGDSERGKLEVKVEGGVEFGVED